MNNVPHNCNTRIVDACDIGSGVPDVRSNIATVYNNDPLQIQAGLLVYDWELKDNRNKNIEIVDRIMGALRLLK